MVPYPVQEIGSMSLGDQSIVSPLATPAAEESFHLAKSTDNITTNNGNPCGNAFSNFITGPRTDQEVREGLEFHSVVEDIRNRLQRNRGAIATRMIRFVQRLWLFLLNNTDSGQLRDKLQKIVSELESYQEKIANPQTTDDEINSIIQRLTKYLKTVNAMVHHYKSSWINLNTLELLSMIRPVLLYFIGICETTGNPSDQRIKDLIDKTYSCLDDVESAIEYFRNLKLVAFGCFGGAVISGIATVVLLFVSPPAAGMAALGTVGLGIATYAMYSGLKQIAEMTESDGDDKGDKIVADCM